MKTLLLIAITLFTFNLVFCPSNLSAQTTLSVGEFNFFSYSPNQPSVFKVALVTGANQTIGKWTISALMAGTSDSIAKGYVGTGVSYEVFGSKDLAQSIYLGINSLKGEQKDALLGASIALRMDKTLVSLNYQRDIVIPNNWFGIGVSQIILK